MIVSLILPAGTARLEFAATEEVNRLQPDEKFDPSEIIMQAHSYVNDASILESYDKLPSSINSWSTGFSRLLPPA
jgi:hypothetical protein